MAWYDTWPTARSSSSPPLFLALAFVTALGIGFLFLRSTSATATCPTSIPVFLQMLPLLSGVLYALDELPEKWQWILSLNPMTAVIAGWRWAMLDAADARLAASRGRRRGRA